MTHVCNVLRHYLRLTLTMTHVKKAILIKLYFNFTLYVPVVPNTIRKDGTVTPVT